MTGKQTFILEIKNVGNETWQGELEWIQGHRKQSFHSMLEMIRLIDSIISGEPEKETGG